MDHPLRLAVPGGPRRRPAVKIWRRLTAGLLLSAVAAPAAFAAGAAEKKGCRIGLAMHFMRDDYAVGCVEAVNAVAAGHPGSKVIATDANADPAKQLSDIENLIARGVDAIIVVPFDEKAILPAIRAANRKGVPVVAITFIPNAEVATTVAASGDYENGRATGEFLAKKMGGRGKLAVIDLGFSLWRIEQRLQGFLDAIRGTAIEIVARQSGTDQAAVQNKVAAILAAHPDLDAVWCAFSNQIVAASDALRDANRRHVLLSGIDADKAIIKRIKEGWITGTAAQFPREHGRLAAEAVFEILAGRAVDRTYNVPVGVVTAENADEMSRKIWDK